jgi:hypothetical protein
MSHIGLDMRFVRLHCIMNCSLFVLILLFCCRPTVNSFCAFSIKFSQDDSEILTG